MLINKINSVGQNVGFKSLKHMTNNVGEIVQQFNYLYDHENEICEIQIFRVTPTDKYNYKVHEDKPIKTYTLTPKGTIVNIQRDTNLDEEEAYAYKVVRKDKNTGKVIWEGADTGVNIREQDGEFVFRVHNGELWKNGKYNDYNPDGTPVQKNYRYPSEKLDGPDNYKYTLVTRKGTTPVVQGIGYLGMPDNLMPAMKYRSFNETNTGELWEDKEFQRKLEGTIRTASNMYGGGIAGLEAMVPVLKEMGVKLFFTTPIANGDNVNAHGYANKNNFQIAPNMGTLENLKSLIRKEFANGIGHVYDATLTSEGLEGIHFQYAMRWGEDAQTYNWFRMNGIKDSNIGLGVVPKNAENLRHRIINSPYIYELKSNGTYEKKVNPNYDEHKETLIQLYDCSQIERDELEKLDEYVRAYTNLKSGKELKINTHDDTITNYVFQINPNEYNKRIDTINDLIKSGKNIKLDSSDGTILVSQFSNFRIDRKPGSGLVTWDANADLVKYNYGISGYDEMENQAIVNRSQRQFAQTQRVIGGIEVTDMASQTGSYWTELFDDTQILYTAQTLGKIDTEEGISKLIAEGKLPEEIRVDAETIKNIINRQYKLSPKGALPKDDITIKALMKLPLESLEFGENIQGVLATSYFTNRATTKETIGKSRFELYKANNPHLRKEYANVYNKTNSLFTDEIKNFADSIISKVNETSETKLLDSAGNYTEYGEYVIELVGREISRYALLKSLAGDNFKVKLNINNDLTYDLDSIRKNTTLKKLGINGVNPQDEASQLQQKIQKGLKSLNSEDRDNIARYISTLTKGMNTNSFRLGEALTHKAGLGCNHRIDANKDFVDVDAVRNRYDDVDDAWNNLIQITRRYVEAVKAKNPHAYLVSEMTDVDKVFRDTYGGPDSDPFNGQSYVKGKRFNGEPDAMTKFFNETGITSEAAYSYFFTELLNSFTYALDLESGVTKCDTHDDFKHKLDLLMKTRSVDYMRNLYTFVGNHDKARILHSLSIDMNLFYSQLIYEGVGENSYRYNRTHRLEAARILSGSATEREIPLELRLNVDNLDYYRTVSSRAVAQTKVLMDSVNEDLNGIASSEDIKLIKDALIDLTNGNYMISKTTEKMTIIKIKELSSVENAVSYIAANAGLSEKDKAQLINKIYTLDFNDFLVHGDFNYGDGRGDINKKYLREILGTDNNAMDYSVYTVQVARLIKKAAEGTSMESSVNTALKGFVQKYNRKMINDNSDGLKLFESPIIANKKNGYAARDFRDALVLALEQAEFKSGRKINNKEAIINTVYKSVTEPAVQKHKMLLSYLGALCGIPTLYSGDEYGLTGYDDKTKNIWLQNRGLTPHSEINDDNSIMGKLRRNIKAHTIDALRHKMNPDLSVLRNGTPYSMDVLSNNKTREENKARLKEIDLMLEHVPEGRLKAELLKEREMICSELSKVAVMTQDTNGDVAISVFYAGGINHDHRFNYFKKLGIENKEQRRKYFAENNIDSINPDNPYVPIQQKTELDALILGAGIALPIGTTFYNINGKDKIQYVVKKVGDGLGVVRKDGKKIIMDGLTSKNGVMILKKLSFKGNPNKKFYNEKFNIAPNSYQEVKENKIGEKLSLISK